MSVEAAPNPILIRIVDEFEVDMTAVAVYN